MVCMELTSSGVSTTALDVLRMCEAFSEELAVVALPVQ